MTLDLGGTLVCRGQWVIRVPGSRQLRAVDGFEQGLVVGRSVCGIIQRSSTERRYHLCQSVERASQEGGAIGTITGPENTRSGGHQGAVACVCGRVLGGRGLLRGCQSKQIHTTSRRITGTTPVLGLGLLWIGRDDALRHAWSQIGGDCSRATHARAAATQVGSLSLVQAIRP